MANLKQKFAKAIKKGNPEDPKGLKDVNLKANNYFTGPFAKMKAKRAIKKDQTDIATAKKTGLTGRDKTFVYKDKKPTIEVYGETFPGKNKPYLSKKIVTTRRQKKEKGNEEFYNAFKKS